MYSERIPNSDRVIEMRLAHWLAARIHAGVWWWCVETGVAIRMCGKQL